jgi:acetate kinase
MHAADNKRWRRHDQNPAVRFEFAENCSFARRLRRLWRGLDKEQGQPGRREVIEQYLAGIGTARYALSAIFAEWRKQLAERQMPLAAIGHRIVHGGSDFVSATLVTSAVSERLASLDAYAPLHNPLNCLGVSMAETAFPELPQYDVFDTAFHRKIPDYAVHYPVPPSLSNHVDFYRYGFHGISCRHSLARAAELLAKDRARINCISCIWAAAPARLRCGTV